MRSNRLGWNIALLLAMGTSIATPAMAAYDSYMTIKGTKQGQFKGEPSGRPGRQEIKLLNVVLQMGGNGKHRSVVVTKNAGPASMQLMQAATSSEVLPSVTIEFVIGGKSSTDQVEKIELRNAVISNFKQNGGHEEISFTYQAIQVSYQSGKTSTADDWTVPNQ